MTPDALRDIRERAEKATPGPWQDKYGDYRPSNDCSEIIGNVDCDADDEGRPRPTYTAVCVIEDTDDHDANADFIAHARDDIPALLAHIDSLTASRGKVDGVRPEVAAFALLMERELRANDHKGGWKQDAPDVLARRVAEEADELQGVADEATIHSPVPKDVAARIAEEAADVANMAMMVADVCGCLPAPTAPAAQPDEAMVGLPTHRHYKGGLYRFIARGKDSETLEDVVIYKHIAPHEPGYWVRPANMFYEVDRFTPLTEDEARAAIRAIGGVKSND